ncbi:MAG: Ig-like domain-containing protein, partial [Ignavibacteriales bacterium]|nr:Ig-like domain-containing protein [Ignavibacteriales bacterium]
TVPSSYSPLSGTLDNYKTINKIKVTLQPDGKIYNGDEFNNGYYFFDELTPGNYTVIVEVDKMRPDTSTVTVKTNESVFNDRMVALNPILDPPKIISYAPADSVNEVSNVSPIVIDFDIRMNITETQNAFSITPAVNGTISWNAAYTKLTFTPTKSYVSGTKYLVTITTSAKTHFGIYLPQKKNFSFTTRSKLNLVSTYPVSGVSNISTTVLMRLVFDKGIDASTLVQKISVADSLGNLLALTANQAKYSAGIIEFESKVPLNNNTLYKITVREGIGDVEYVKFLQTVTIEFRTEKNLTFTGNILEGFETENVWQSPLLSSNTQGVVSNQTSFSILNQRKISGENSGRLDYTFSGQDGTIELALVNPITLGTNPTSEFGVWIFGDAGNNILEYRFIRQNSIVEKVKIDTINWTGWKMKKILLNQIPGSGSIQFKSINVLQSTVGSLTGRLFFDDCLTNIVTDIYSDGYIPNEFRLEQNFPNPFNPETTIQYTIPSVETRRGESLQHVILKVYDMLGREVAALVNENKTPGNYEIKFNAGGLASGIYFYRLQAGNFTASKKLILLK